MSEVTDPLAWVDKAEEDLTLAQSAMRRKKPLTAGACFHAQQCAEKYLKAILVNKQLDFPKTHDLLALNTLVMQAGLPLGLEVKKLAVLSAYAVTVRYPGAEPTVEETREALATTKEVRRIARKWLGLR